MKEWSIPGTWKLEESILVSDKLDLQPKLVRRDKCHYVFVKGTVHPKDRTILNTYVLIFGVHNFMIKTLLVIERHIGPDTMIVGNLNSPVSLKDRSFTQNYQHIS